MSDKKPTLMDWLGLNIQPDFSKARWLGGLVSVAFIALIALLALPALYQFFKAVTGFGDFGGLAKQHEAIRNSGLVVAALVGVPFVIWRSAVAQKQVNVAEQGHITDRINKAVESLGAQNYTRKMVDHPQFKKQGTSWKRDENGDPVPQLSADGQQIITRELLEYTEPNIEVRIGAIYALERIAKEDLSFHIQIMEILCAYIRHNAPASLASDDPQNLTEPRDDIQTALTVLGRRSESQIAVERAVKTPDGKGHRLDLRETCLQAVDLSDLNFELARFEKANLQGAKLGNANLQGAELGDANLQGAHLGAANLQGAYLVDANLQGANLRGANLQGAKLWRANLQGANLLGANLQGADLWRANLQGAKLWDANLQGAKLWDAKIDDTTSLKPAALRGAGLREFDFTHIINPALLAEAFGDASVTLPDGYVTGQGDLPHWSSKELGDDEFHDQWRAHQKSIGFEP